MATKINPKLPRQIKKFIRLWKKAFGLPAWPIFYIPCERITDKWGDEALMGITVDDSNAEVKITYRPDLIPSDDVISRLICHELLHWVFDPADRYVEERFSKRDFKTYSRFMEAAVEVVALTFTDPDRSAPSTDGWFLKPECGCSNEES